MKRLHRFFLFLCIFFLFSKADFISASTVSQTKIHFISLNSTSDAILLESNGHYGMVDSGEDWDYPNSSSYPFRTGISTGIGFEQQVIHYLKTVGVKKLDFYIATHAHSDHIGSGDEILRHFPTDRLYINRYDDSYMLDSHGTDPSDPYYIEDAQENRLWDNQYIYDCLIEAAQDTGTQIITDLDLDENASYRSFTLGDMQIEIMNYERLRDDNGNIIPVSSENNNCLVTKITAYNHVALLTSDMEPLDGDTTKIALQLIDQLGGDSDDSSAETDSLSDDVITSSQSLSSSDGVTLDLPEDRSETGLQITKEFSSDSISAFSLYSDDLHDSDIDGKQIQIIVNILFFRCQFFDHLHQFVQFQLIALSEKSESSLRHLGKFRRFCDLFCFPDISLGKCRVDLRLIIRQMHMLHQIFFHITLFHRTQIQGHAPGRNRRKQRIRIAGQKQDHRISRWLLDGL